MKKVPTRRCVMCRGRAPKAELLRFVMAGQDLVWDREGRLSGRGAYLHCVFGCLRRVRERTRWEAALRLKGADLTDGSLEALDRLLRDTLREFFDDYAPRGFAERKVRL